MHFSNDEPTRRFIDRHKSTFINLINAQYMLRFANNSFYLDEKVIPKDTSAEDIINTLNSIDST
jgi:hypothetical protein